MADAGRRARAAQLRARPAAAGGALTCVVVRHASAGSAHEWAGDDSLRPLDARGREQAAALVGELRSLDIRRVVSSPAVRCVDTVAPLAAELELEVERDDRLAEGGGRAAQELLAEDGVVVCTHGDVAEALTGRALKKAGFVLL